MTRELNLRLIVIHPCGDQSRFIQCDGRLLQVYPSIPMYALVEQKEIYGHPLGISIEERLKPIEEVASLLWRYMRFLTHL